MRFETAEGEELSFEEIDRHRWRVSHPAVRPPRRPRRAAGERREPPGLVQRRDYYRPILEPGLLHAIGNLFLLLPDHLEWDVDRDLELSYRGFAEAGWEVVDSFGTGAGPRSARATLAEFNHALFVAGELDVHHREVAGSPLVVSLAGDGWVFEGTELADLVARIVGLERELMGDEGLAALFW